MVCCECGTEMQSTRGAAFEITGFERERKQGGTNHVLWREPTGRVMCSTCVIRKTHGIIPGQLSIA